MIQALVPILVAVFNAVGPGIIEMIQRAMIHPSLDDNGKAAIDALGVTLASDEKHVDATPPLPDPKPTAPG